MYLLKKGDRVILPDGEIGVVTKVFRFGLIEPSYHVDTETLKDLSYRQSELRKD